MSGALGELTLLDGGRPVHAIPLGSRPVFLGRSPDSDLVLTDPSISKHHAVIFLPGARRGLQLRDLGSTNGTSVNGVRLVHAAGLADGDLIRLGAGVELQVRLCERVGVLPASAHPSLLVHLDSGLAVTIPRGSFVLGGHPSCDVALAALGELSVAVSVSADGVITLLHAEHPLMVVSGEPFEFMGQNLVFRHSRSQLVDTIPALGCAPAARGYQLSVHLGGRSGSQAVVLDGDGGLHHCVRTEYRVALLYVLGRRLQQDRAKGLEEGEQGWVEDSQVMQGIWGRGWKRRDPNNYQVLIHRVRNELRDAGLDRDIIEKAMGRTRLLVERVRIGGGQAP
jgi:hypothetical protein